MGASRVCPTRPPRRLLCPEACSALLAALLQQSSIRTGWRTGLILAAQAALGSSSSAPLHRKGRGPFASGSHSPNAHIICLGLSFRLLKSLVRARYASACVMHACAVVCGVFCLYRRTHLHYTLRSNFKSQKRQGSIVALCMVLQMTGKIAARVASRVRFPPWTGSLQTRNTAEGLAAGRCKVSVSIILTASRLPGCF